MDKLYTFIFEWEGGTYVSQFSAINLDVALKSWSAEILKSEIEFDNSQQLQIAGYFEENDNKPRPLDGISSVWCEMVVLNEGAGLLNIVLTCEHCTG